MSDAATTPPPLPLPPPPPAPSGGRGCLKFALIGCGVIALLGILLVVAMVVWWNRNAEGLEEQAARAAQEGSRFGLVRDEAACFEEGRRRAAEGGSFEKTFAVGAFMRACMEFSRPTPGFCDDVPPATSIGRTVAWQSQRCGDDLVCRNVSQAVQSYCSEGRPKRPAADTLLDLGRGEGSARGAVDPGAPPAPGSDCGEDSARARREE